MSLHVFRGWRVGGGRMNLKDEFYCGEREKMIKLCEISIKNIYLEKNSEKLNFTERKFEI